MLIAIVFMALLGAAIGSFASVVAHRVPKGESIVAPRSRCPTCGTQVSVRDNIPILSWLLLRGRCRHCGESISPFYPLIEFGLAAGFVGALLVFEDQAEEIAISCAFLTTLAIITITDLEHRIIPNVVLIVSGLVGVALIASTAFDSAPERAISAAIAFTVLLLIALAYPSGMGMGDVKLAGIMGLYLGKAVAPGLMIGFLVGAVYGVALIAIRGAEARKQAVPFGPFLALGGVVALFVGDDIVDWYVENFFE